MQKDNSTRQKRCLDFAHQKSKISIVMSLHLLYEDDKYCDITFKLDSGNVYRAHRVVLACSNVLWFNKILEGQISRSRISNG